MQQRRPLLRKLFGQEMTSMGSKRFLLASEREKIIGFKRLSVVVFHSPTWERAIVEKKTVPFEGGGDPFLCVPPPKLEAGTVRICDHSPPPKKRRRKDEKRDSREFFREEWFEPDSCRGKNRLSFPHSRFYPKRGGGLHSDSNGREKTLSEELSVSSSSSFLRRRWWWRW